MRTIHHSKWLKSSASHTIPKRDSLKSNVTKSTMLLYKDPINEREESVGSSSSHYHTSKNKMKNLEKRKDHYASLSLGPPSKSKPPSLKPYNFPMLNLDFSPISSLGSLKPYNFSTFDLDFSTISSLPSLECYNFPMLNLDFSLISNPPNLYSISPRRNINLPSPRSSSSSTSNCFSNAYFPSRCSNNNSPSFHDALVPQYCRCHWLQSLDKLPGNCKENPICLDDNCEENPILLDDEFP